MPRFPELVTREFETLSRTPRWFPWRWMPNRGWSPIRRGFAYQLHMPLGQFQKRAAALLAAHPIERVTLTDKTPILTHISGGYRCYGWSTTYLPRTVFDALCEDERCDMTLGEPPSFAAFPDGEQSAIDAMSDALVNYGRKLVGLDPLPVCTGAEGVA